MNQSNYNKITFKDLVIPIKVALGNDWVVSPRSTIMNPDPKDGKEHWHLIVELVQMGEVKDQGECIFELDYGLDLSLIDQVVAALKFIRRNSDGGLLG